MYNSYAGSLIVVDGLEIFVIGNILEIYCKVRCFTVAELAHHQPENPVVSVKLQGFSAVRAFEYCRVFDAGNGEYIGALLLVIYKHLAYITAGCRNLTASVNSAYRHSRIFTY